MDLVERSFTEEVVEIQPREDRLQAVKSKPSQPSLPNVQLWNMRLSLGYKNNCLDFLCAVFGGKNPLHEARAGGVRLADGREKVEDYNEEAQANADLSWI